MTDRAEILTTAASLIGGERQQDYGSAAEIWQPIPDYEGHYAASSAGRIRSLDRDFVGRDGRRQVVRGKIRRQRLNPDGYYQICLSIDGVQSTTTVHKLVCAAFHGRRPDGMSQTRHLNGVRIDNRPENLCWGTAAENCWDMHLHGRSPRARTTHCKRGHEFTPANTRWCGTRTGGILGLGMRRICVTCDRIRHREAQERKRAKLLVDNPGVSA